MITFIYYCIIKALLKIIIKLVGLRFFENFISSYIFSIPIIFKKLLFCELLRLHNGLYILKCFSKYSQQILIFMHTTYLLSLIIEMKIISCTVETNKNS